MPSEDSFFPTMYKRSIMIQNVQPFKLNSAEFTAMVISLAFLNGVVFKWFGRQKKQKKTIVLS